MTKEQLSRMEELSNILDYSECGSEEWKMLTMSILNFAPLSRKNIVLQMKSRYRNSTKRISRERAVGNLIIPPSGNGIRTGIRMYTVSVPVLVLTKLHKI